MPVQRARTIEKSLGNYLEIKGGYIKRQERYTKRAIPAMEILETLVLNGRYGQRELLILVLDLKNRDNEQHLMEKVTL
jgi:hypothetical protein